MSLIRTGYKKKRRNRALKVTLTEDEIKQIDMIKEAFGYYYRSQVLYRALKEFLERHKDLLEKHKDLIRRR